MDDDIRARLERRSGNQGKQDTPPKQGDRYKDEVEAEKALIAAEAVILNDLYHEFLPVFSRNEADGLSFRLMQVKDMGYPRHNEITHPIELLFQGLDVLFNKEARHKIALYDLQLQATRLVLYAIDQQHPKKGKRRLVISADESNSGFTISSFETYTNETVVRSTGTDQYKVKTKGFVESKSTKLADKEAVFEALKEAIADHIHTLVHPPKKGLWGKLDL